MAQDNAPDWNPDAYARFEGHRRQPARDLLARIGTLPMGPIVDLGCGAGGVGSELALLAKGAALIGVDSAATMLERARQTGLYSDLAQADIATWTPEVAPVLIFSNAALHWVPDHAALMPRLANFLRPGGRLAVQMPRQYEAPSHALLREISADMFPNRFSFSDWHAPVARPEDYMRLLAPLGPVSVWETTYIQRLEPLDHSAHPVRAFTEATAMRPFAAKLDAQELAVFTSAYEAQLAAAYPQADDGSVLFPFTRVFFVLER